METFLYITLIVLWIGVALYRSVRKARIQDAESGLEDFVSAKPAYESLFEEETHGSYTQEEKPFSNYLCGRKRWQHLLLLQKRRRCVMQSSISVRR